jgi:hypothetical protein
MRTQEITEASKQVFIAYAKDAANWSGTPLVGGNVGGTKEERGNLTQLKRAGLITTMLDGKHTWLAFTPAGVRFAAELGLDVSWAPEALRTTLADMNNDREPAASYEADRRANANAKAPWA